ncbi:MAG TPA: kelch repeat-containing protein [Chitinophagaceae bacterium]|nr:kelch repeat-containing protein [Chitinophagaceae bacterium]
MKRYFYLLLLFPLAAGAQITSNSEWTWIKGDNTSNVNAVYGVKGVPDPSNKPGGRSRGMSVRDAAGNIWLFGGEAFFTTGGTSNYSNDLWKYDITTNVWTWISGLNTGGSLGVYGTQGVADAANMPRARAGAAIWLDDAGNIWIFGGIHSAARLNDLWKYDPVTNMWTWMKGDNTPNQTAVPGTLGVAASTNKPGSRVGTAYWKDASGNLWMFGGDGYGGTGLATLNDLWKYDPVTNMWTWMDGNPNGNQFGTYGTQGEENAANQPGQRFFCDGWIDAAGNFWIFGGTGRGAADNGLLNDLWRYNPVTGNWTWMKGSTSPDTVGVYGTMGVADAANTPGARQNYMSCKGADGNFYLMGGNGFASALPSGFLNDMWKYDLSTNQWTWLKGDNVPNVNGVYGTLGTPDAANKPGSRNHGEMWTDNAGNIWLFGGNGFAEADFGRMNDVWRLNGSGSLPLHFVALRVAQRNQQVAVQWETAAEINTSHFNVQRSKDGRNFMTIAKVAAAGNGSKTYEFMDAAIDHQNISLYYRIEAVDLDGTIKYSSIKSIKIGQRIQFTIGPNPARNYFIIDGDNIDRIEVFDLRGRRVYSRRIASIADRNIHTSGWSNGMYIVKLTDGDGNTTITRIIKQ